MKFSFLKMLIFKQIYVKFLLNLVNREDKATGMLKRVIHFLKETKYLGLAIELLGIPQKEILKNEGLERKFLK